MIEFHKHTGQDSPLIDRDANNVPNIYTMTITPSVSGLIPKKPGDIFINQSTSKIYISQNNTSTSDWLILN